TAGIAAHADRGEAGRNCRARAAAGSSRIAGRSVWIARLSAVRADCDDSRGQFVHVRFGDDDGAGFAKLAHLKSVAVRDKTGQRDGAGGGRVVGRVLVVLDDNRNAVQRSADMLLSALAI